MLRPAHVWIAAVKRLMQQSVTPHDWHVLAHLVAPIFAFFADGRFAGVTAVIVSMCAQAPSTFSCDDSVILSRLPCLIVLR